MSTASSVCLFPRPISAQMTNWNHFVIVKWPSVFSEQVPYWSSPCLFSVALQRSVWRSILGSGRVRRLIKSQQGSLGQASGNPIANVVHVVRSLDSEATAQLKCHCDLFFNCCIPVSISLPHASIFWTNVLFFTMPISWLSFNPADQRGQLPACLWRQEPCAGGVTLKYISVGKDRADMVGSFALWLWRMLREGAEENRTWQPLSTPEGQWQAYRRSQLKLQEKLLSCAVWKDVTVFAMPWALASTPVCSPHWGYHLDSYWCKTKKALTSFLLLQTMLQVLIL